MNKKLRSFVLAIILVGALSFLLGLFVGRNDSQVTPTQTPETTITETQTQAPSDPVETPVPSDPVETPAENNETIAEDGSYTSKEDVALYIHTYGKLPDNFVTKSEAKDLGWVASKNNLHKVCEGCSIGGDNFGNREGLLPKKSGRKYYECDIDYDGGGRNAKRIVFSNDGLVYYTDDHYKSFTLLYGEP